MGEDDLVNAAFLLGYLLLLGGVYWRARSLAWLVISIAGAGAVTGSLVNFAMDRGHDFTRVELQWILLATLAAVAVLAWVPRLGFGVGAPGTSLVGTGMGWKRQGLAILLPAALLLAFLVLMTTMWTEEPAFVRPVSFLIGHGVAEDNAKWLDFAAQWAAGNPIDQGVPMGGPLQLIMTFVGTVMAVVSQVTLGGFNEVAVAANTVVYGEFFMAILVILALAPLAEARIGGKRIPAPLIWFGAVVISAATLVVMNFGHLTLQFTFLVLGLWSATFLSGLRMRRARLLTSMAAAAAMTVWLPLGVAAFAVCGGWLVVLVSRGLRGERRWDLPGLGIWAVVTVGVVGPIVSGVVYGLNLSTPAAAGAIGGAVRGVAARVSAGLADSPLFSASGGTEATTLVLGLLAGAAVLGAAAYLAPIAGPLSSSLARRFMPLILLGVSAIGIYVLDFWATGSGPHYGSQKFTFMVVILALATAGPIALAALDRSGADRMTSVQWIGLGVAVLVLMLDSMVPRAVAMLRPEQWSPPIPFDNTSGSYWYPAEVNGEASQPISSLPVGCVYLPPGAIVPSAVVPSGLSDAQRVYNCTRLLAGLSGADTMAQPIVDWLRREWLTNATAWSPAYPPLQSMPQWVRDRQMILLDEGSNVIGLESLQSLLDRFPQRVAE